MLLIRCKVSLKLKWTKSCALALNSTETPNADPDNTIFTIKDKNLYVSVVALSAKDNQKLSKLLSKGFERSVYTKQKMIIKLRQMSLDIFLNQTL